MPIIIPPVAFGHPSDAGPSPGWNSHLVALKARDVLIDYLPGYIGVVERRYFLDNHLPLPTAYVAAAQTDTGTPSLGNTRVFVICPGLADAPEETPEGGYMAPYALMVGIEVQSRGNRESVDAQLAYYQEAIRECVLREGQKVFGSTVIDWTDENTDSGDPAMALTQGAGISTFAVYLQNVVADTASLFPDGPPEDPYEPIPAGPVVDQVDYEIINHAIDEQL